MSVASPAHPGVNPAISEIRTTRLRHADLPEVDRNLTVGMHLSPYASLLGIGPLAFFLPLIFWLVWKDRSVFVDDHGREIINFGLSLLLFHAILMVTIIGVVLWPVLWIVAIVSTIRAAVAAGQNEYFRYPITIRFLS